MMEWTSPSGSSASEDSYRFLYLRFLNRDFLRRDESRAERGRKADINDIAGFLISRNAYS